MAGLMQWQRDMVDGLMRQASQKQDRGLMSHYKSASAMPREIINRGGILPIGRDAYTGQIVPAMPGMGQDVADAVTLPSRVMEGYQPSMEDIGNLALTVGAGGLAGTAPKGALRSGLSRDAPEGIRAYHGSPHDFDRFRWDDTTRGTGEGAQAYGDGLYFAGNEGVARNYRDALSIPRRGSDPPHFAALGGPPKHIAPDTAHDIRVGGMKAAENRMAEVQKTIEGHIKQIKELPDGAVKDSVKEDLPFWINERDELARIVESGDVSTTIPGKMYEVSIKANPEDFLDFDKPFSQQSDKAKAAIKTALVDRGLPVDETGTPLMLARDPLGQDIHNSLSVMRDQSKTTGELSSKGIAGIRYLDQGSRKATDVNDLRGTVSMWRGAVKKTPNDEYAKSQLKAAEDALNDAETALSHNYVVFDDSLIEILRKYGLAGLAPMGAAAGGGLMSGFNGGEN